jgi:hypothetical protein
VGTRKPLHLSPEIPGDADDNDSPVAFGIKNYFERGGALIVKQVVIPLPFYNFGDKNGDQSVRMTAFKLEDVFENWGNHEAVRGSQYH